MTDPTLLEEDKRIVGLHIQEKLNQLEILQHKTSQDHLAAKICLESESPVSKFWAKSGREQKTHDAIVELRVPESPSNAPAYEHRSDKMAELARKYYDDLQKEGMAQGIEREEALTKVLNTIDIKLSESNKTELETPLTKGNIEEVLGPLPNGKAPGIDGIPYEFWKWLNEKAKSIPKDDNGESPFDFAECLTAVYNDIESHGVVDASSFAEGLLHPIHKKKDRHEIANYRPIMLLNSNYKALTKTLALKLTRTVPSIIHKN
ncbi:hypothetical protein DEU56DRAFT_757692 [Suillus clintonianus]|uniref:uncharacterized protein n=1 Tax=Suillus clintonianus TaxID=1904413 RepID=UPI001B877F0A|nr:uncharacterized protein DEU56DRAFT_757692 [Suillus clintonianus]KAG2131066.1 hypothetical protein DEU56DRAFT_757692 [Suillus clintonianus]